jgi:hypothetical protein
MVTLHLKDAGRVQYGTQDYTFSKGLCDFIRRNILQPGVNESEVVVVFRGSTLCFKPLTVKEWSYWSISENDKRFKFIPYKENPLYAENKS